MQVSTTSLAVLLVGAACVLQSTAYDCPNNLQVCSCVDDYIFCSGLNFIPQMVPASKEQNWTFLSFSEGNLTSVEKGNLPAGLEYIEFTGNPIMLIADDAFDDSATTLQTLHISGAKLRELPQALLKLTNLSELYIADTPIEVYNESILEHIGTKLTTLHLINVVLSAWPGWMSYFHVLNTISLDRNFIQSIPDNAFSSGVTSLQDLSLVSTNLTHMPKALSTLANLTALDLSSNNFVDLTEFETFLPFGSKLSTLKINQVSLTRILNFSNLTSLYTLNLDNNNISDPSTGSLPPSVSSLHLANNLLPSVPSVVANMSRLSYLDLSNNNVSRIEPDAFPTSLRDLYLSYNQITEINPGDFPSNLRRLIMRFNQIAEIKTEPFPLSLDNLDLRNNQIKQIDPDNFPSHLSKLDLSYNEINDIVPDNFPSGLDVLVLSYNNLSVISTTTFANLTVLHWLLLNNNPISTISVSAFADLKSLTQLVLSYTNLTEVPVALGDLPKGSTRVSLFGLSSLVCPCPKSTKLSNWIESGTIIVGGYCSNGYRVNTYLGTRCETDTTPAVEVRESTTPAIEVTESTTPPGKVCAIGYSLSSLCAALCVYLYIAMGDVCGWGDV